ncbi:MAG: ABC transporter ATP-binding protein [Bacteroidetes bacterium]|nr:MAG: ABC transporter ATP-binding protein [Bacteroidota bacterium]
MQQTPVLRFWNLLKLYRTELRQIYAYAIFNGIVNLSLPLGIQAIINFLQTGEMTSSWVLLVIFVLFGIALTGIIQVYQLRIVENIQQDIFARSAVEFAYRIPRIKILQLDKIHAPELVNRFFDTLTIQKGLPKILIDFSLASFQIVFGLILLAIYSPFFIILGLSLFLILGIIFRITGRRGLNTSLKESKFKYNLAHWLEEVARTNKSFKVNAYNELHLDKTDDITSKYLNAREKHFGVLLDQFRYFIGFKVFVAAGLLLLGGFLVFREQMNIGQFVAAEIIIILIINSVEKVIRVIETIYDVLTALEKIGYVTDLDLDADTGQLSLQAKGPLKVEVHNLVFGFPNMKTRLFDDFSMKIPPGSKAVICGTPGTGKSTLLQLISGVQKPEEGEIVVNNIPIDNYSRKEFYNKIGMSFSTNDLFEGTIKENILMGRDVADEKLQEVINLLGLNEYVARQPGGVNCSIDSGGRRLPRSLIQKLLVARTIIGEPGLLLMEDPLQFVSDAEKNKIIDYVMSPERDWTVIVVADYYYWREKSTLLVELEKTN